MVGSSVMTGFGHNTVLSVADKVVNAVKNGDISHFFLVVAVTVQELVEIIILNL